MTKKIISFIVILLAYLALGAALIISTSYFGLGFGENNAVLHSAYALDRAGNICFVSDNEEEKTLVCIDSSGKKLYEHRLEAQYFGDCFYIDSIYVEHDKNIYITSCSYDKDSMIINNVSVHSFYEDGSYAQRVFSGNVKQYMNSRAHLISSFSESDTEVFFSLISGDRAEVFSVPKNNSEQAAKVAEYELSEQEVYGTYTSSSKELFVGSDRGISVYTESGRKTVYTGKGSVFDRFWNGINMFYAMDSSTGDIYTISQDRMVAQTLSGHKVINAEENLSINDMTDITVGITGNTFGCIRGETDRMYTGSFSIMYKIATDSVDKSAVFNRILAAIAVAAVIIALSVLTWDFYCGILKMNLSILLRQSIIMMLLISSMLFLLSWFIIVPQVENIVTANYRHEAQMTATSFVDALSGVIADEGSGYRTDSDYLTGYGKSIALLNDNDFSGDDEKPQVNIIERNGGKCRIVASGELYPTGYPADTLLYLHNLTDIINGMTDTDTFVNSRSPEGDKLYLIRDISPDSAPGSKYIVVGLRLSGMSEAVDEIRTVINRFLLIGGIVIVVLFVAIENITAGAVRKLKRSVDRIASGEYNAAVILNTGDEIEDLSKSVMALSRHIIDKTTSLEKLNNSYYRFVPLSFLKNLGETQIERVSKSLYAKRRMSVMYLNFEFSQNLSGMDTEEIFESINSVFEQIVPIISRNSGTAYNFLYNGFHAIFPDSVEDAMQAAIRVRECVSAYNEARKVQGKRSVDVRIVISEDDVMLGFIGDEMRMEPTAVASGINQADEIEHLCRDSGLFIICTERAYNALPSGKYRSRCIGKYTAQDQSEVKLYDMFDSDPYSMIKLKEQYITRFELAVRLFEKKDFTNARGQFMDIVKYAADDGVSRNYMYLSEYNITAEKPQLTYNIFNEF